MRRTLLVIAASLAGCASPVALGQTAWQATLSGGPSGISASVGAVSATGRTHASIALERGVPGQRYGWRIQQGDCQSAGALVSGAASYPVLTAAADGTAGTDVYLSQAMTDGPYVARVLVLSADGSEALAACGAFQRAP